VIFYQESSVQAVNAPTWNISASVSDAHGVSDINSISWFPTEKHSDWLASGGDDGVVNIWRYIDEDA
jgi:cytosolic iron-sulfur protein assembly protein CIAO1